MMDGFKADGIGGLPDSAVINRGFDWESSCPLLSVAITPGFC